MTSPASPLVCHVFMSKLANESRLEKEIGFLRAHGFDAPISVLGVADSDVVVSLTLRGMADVQVFSPDAPLRRVPVLGKVLRFLRWATQVRRTLRRETYALVVAHSLPALVVCSFARRLKGRLIYDAHEYETERNGFAPWQRQLARIAERLTIGKADEVWAVSPSIIEAYRADYPKIPARLIMNMPPEPDPAVDGPDLRAQLDIPAERLVCGYLGALGPGRSIALYLETFAKMWETGATDRNDIPDLVILGSGSLQDMCKDYASRYPNIHALPPVPPDQVVAASRSFDVGLCLIDPTSQSYKYSLPNKFFQHLSAGNFLIVLTDSVDMLRFAKDDNRIVATTSDHLAKTIHSTAQLLRRHRQTPFATDQTYYWESQVDTLRAAFSMLPLTASQKAGDEVS